MPKMVECQDSITDQRGILPKKITPNIYIYIYLFIYLKIENPGLCLRGLIYIYNMLCF